MFPIGPIIEIIGSVLNKVIPNADDRAKAQEEITRKLIENEAAIYDALHTGMAAAPDEGSTPRFRVKVEAGQVYLDGAELASHALDLTRPLAGPQWHPNQASEELA